MFRVTLNVDGQFGPDGPQTGAKGEALCIIKSEGDHWVLCEFVGFEGEYWIGMNHILHPKTDTSETYWSTDA